MQTKISNIIADQKGVFLSNISNVNDRCSKYSAVCNEINNENIKELCQNLGNFESRFQHTLFLPGQKLA